MRLRLPAGGFGDLRASGFTGLEPGRAGVIHPAMEGQLFL
jgi:hypothetical protein